MPWPKKNSSQEFDNEKKFPAAQKFPTPTIIFLMVRTLVTEFLLSIVILATPGEYSV